MAAPLSNAPPPPPNAEQRAQRRKQRRLVWGTVAGMLLLVVAWQVYQYIASAPQRAEQQVQAGVRLLSPGHYEDAIVQFGEALEKNPNSWNAYFQRGIAKQNLGSLDAALSDFQVALQLKPDLLDARTARAEIFRQKGDRPHAIEELSAVIAQKPTVEAHNSRGLAYAELGRHAEAIPDFTWVIEELRDAPFAYFARARSKRALGDLEGALQDEATANTFDRSKRQ